MIKRFLKYYSSLWIVLMLAAITAHAKDVGNLYKVSLPAQSQKQSAKHELIQKGLKQVLIRVSGQPKLINNHSAIKQAVQNAEQYVKSLYYTRSQTSDSHKPPLKLHITYQSKPINQLLKKHKMPVWGQDRPLVLLWMINRNNDEDHILVNTQSNQILQTVSKTARSLNVPVAFPLMDVIDMSRIQPQQLIQGDRQAIHQASKRYDPNAIVVVDFQKRGGRVLSHWQLYFADHTYSWQREDLNSKQMSQKGIQQLTSRLAQHSAVTSSQDQPIQVHVLLHGLNKLKGVAQARRMLEDVAGVQSVHLSQLSGQVGTYNVTINSGLASFVQKLDFSEHLRYNETIKKDGQKWVVAQLT